MKAQSDSLLETAGMASQQKMSRAFLSVFIVSTNPVQVEELDWDCLSRDISLNHMGVKYGPKAKAMAGDPRSMS